MSDHLYPTRLMWDGRSGFARNDGVHIVLAQPPGRQYAEVHYVPGVEAQVRDRDCDARRDMVSSEIKAVQRWLDHMAYAARMAIGEQPPRPGADLDMEPST